MSLLFDVSSDNIGFHIKNIFKDDELDSSTSEESSVVQKEGKGKLKPLILRGYFARLVGTTGFEPAAFSSQN